MGECLVVVFRVGGLVLVGIVLAVGWSVGVWWCLGLWWVVLVGDELFAGLVGCWCGFVLAL